MDIFGGSAPEGDVLVFGNGECTSRSTSWRREVPIRIQPLATRGERSRGCP
jgi:hypothetical protein